LAGGIIEIREMAAASLPPSRYREAVAKGTNPAASSAEMQCDGVPASVTVGGTHGAGRFSSCAAQILDLLAVTHGGRLAILELKAAEKCRFAVAGGRLLVARPAPSASRRFAEVRIF
jgi:hypothetical protein